MRTPSLRRFGGVIAIISPSLRGPRLGAERNCACARGRTQRGEERLLAVDASFISIDGDVERCAHAERCEFRKQCVGVVIGSGDAVQCADPQRRDQRVVRQRRRFGCVDGTADELSRSAFRDGVIDGFRVR